MDKFESRLQIERLIYRYAEAIDQGDLALLESLFVRGSIRVEGQQHVTRGGEAVRQLIERFTAFYDAGGRAVDLSQAAGKPFTRHITSNLYFEQLDDQQAITHSCFTVVQALPGSVFQPIISGRYRDTFGFEDGVWYWLERYEMMDLFGDLSRHLQQNPF